MSYGSRGYCVDETYRGVLTTIREDGSQFTTILGPYNTVGAVRGQVTKHKNWYQSLTYEVRIERATVWEPVE